MRKALSIFLLITLASCSSTYFAALEKIGIPKRELMVTRVKAAQSSQEEAKEQFKDALEKFRVVLGNDGGNLGGNLGKKYDALSAELARSEGRANDVRARIDSVEEVSEALFKEWKKELSQYDNKTLRRSSEEKLNASRVRYDEMIAAMHRAESKLEPALKPLRDNVLYLKHNLNAQVLDSLDGELQKVEVSVDALIRDLEQSINESRRFVQELQRG